jgi:NAD-dependent deacetylase
MAYENLRELIEGSNNIVFLGGAGVSTESNIPDFRSADGLYAARTKYGYSPEYLLSRTLFDKDTELFYDYYKHNLIYTEAKPNLAHFALAKLEEMGKLKAVVTQNIDNLHQMAGSRTVYELHGSVYRNYCMDCHKFYSLEEMLAIEGNVPHCTHCGGVIKPDVVLYEEGLDSDVWNGAQRAIASADMLIVGGTSLVVYPAASLVGDYRGNKLVLINKSATSYDDMASLVINDSIGKVLSEVVMM